ncbi:MAG TPA: hypothetical protein VNQ76_02820 [Planctomicrobium sp.]|nr:hypothetical protein [Planctomicrobium sp.]
MPHHDAVPPPARVPLVGPQPAQQNPVLQQDQLWPHLPARQRQAIRVTLAQMIARQIAALPAPLLTREESDE